MECQNELVIEAGRTEHHYWKDLWRYRELFYFLAWRDILVRYKQTAIGIAWALIRPLLTTVVFVFVFGKVAKLSSDGVPYPIFVFAALLPWQFFANAFAEAGNSLISNAFDIARFANFNLRITVDFQKIVVLHHRARAPPICAIGRDERRQYDHARFHEQFRHFADTPDVLLTVLHRETQITAKSVAHIVPIQNERPAAAPVQAVFHRMGQRRFTRSGQSRKPEDSATMAVLCLTIRSGHSSPMPDYVGRY